MCAREYRGNTRENQAKIHGNEQIRGLISRNFTFFKRDMLGTPTLGVNACLVPTFARVFQGMPMHSREFQGMLGMPTHFRVSHACQDMPSNKECQDVLSAKACSVCQHMPESDRECQGNTREHQVKMYRNELIIGGAKEFQDVPGHAKQFQGVLRHTYTC